MASIIRIKRSSGTNKPATLQWGELGYVTGIGSFGGTNQYKDRVFLGDDGTNAHPIGGHYYTSMMEHAPGTIPAAAHNTRNQDRGVVAIMAPATNSGLGGAESLKVDQWNVDNLRIDLNTISSTDTDGDIILDPNGTGEVQIPDDTFVTFGDGKDSKIEYDENGTDQLTFTGADVRFNIATNSTSKDTGAVIVEGGVGIEKDLNVGGGVTADGHSIFDQVKIADNIISTLSGGTDILYLDPYPDGLSNEGTVVVKGNLQVDGTTTTVNSTSKTLNDPIFHIGDVTSTRTVMADANSGVTSLTLDSVVGINTGDALSGTGIAAATVISSYNTGAKTITFNNATTAGISTTAQVTITHGYDSNTDRGISFAYNSGSGVADNETGFFGMDDSSIANSAADADNHGTHADDSRRWTYVPDAAIANSVVTGTKGFLDIKGIYYQSGDYATGGVVYFDDTGLQRSTNAVASPVVASKQILTAITKKDFVLSVAITASAGDIIRQDTTGAYGVVETGVSGSTTVSLIGIEGTFVTGTNLRREGVNGFISNLASTPNTITDIYTNKPHWTSTLDGGTF
tara:strand:- start:810 stop:2519 length:1710 start_codon:yes stop_codon:yes gene_type:complete